MEPKTVTVRLSPELTARLKKAQDHAGAYAPTITQIMLRGLDLALREIERKKD